VPPSLLPGAAIRAEPPAEPGHLTLPSPVWLAYGERDENQTPELCSGHLRRK